MAYVTDTHSLLWAITEDYSQLSEKAKEIFKKVKVVQEVIFIPCIVFLELIYLVEKRKIDVDFEGFLSLVAVFPAFKIEPLCLPIIRKSREIERTQVPDPWDRIIAATAVHLNLPLISRDEGLKRAGFQIVW